MPKTNFFKFKGLDKKEYSLSLKEKLFCEYYLEFYGSGIKAVYKAGYKVKSDKVATSIASENLIKPDIISYLNLKLEEHGFSDENVRKHHLFLMMQFNNLSVKAKGIDMYYKLTGGYATKKFEFVDEYEDLTDEELEEELARIREEQRKIIREEEREKFIKEQERKLDKNLIKPDLTKKKQRKD